MDGLQLRENIVYKWLVTKVIFLRKEREKKSQKGLFKIFIFPTDYSFKLQDFSYYQIWGWVDNLLQYVL